MVMRDYTQDHKRNILKEQVTSKNKIESGHIVMFNYTGKDVHTRRPLVLVLNPSWKQQLHGLNLDYIPPAVLDKLYSTIKERTAEKIQKFLHLRLPLLKPVIHNPYNFYHKELKKFLNIHFGKNESPYRVYNLKGISNWKIIDYRFKDYYIGKK